MDSYAFRCYTYRENNFWYADCLDLMLLVKRDTMQEAMQELELLILDYVQAARDDENLPLPRPVSFGEWVRFYARLVGHTLRVLLTGHADGLSTYTVQIPAGQMTIVYA
jgi:hypothetical protein